jgi:hypothetical protein
VIVAEEIISRFYNVIRLLNRAVPLIAIQLRAGDEERDGMVQKLSDALPYVRPFRSDLITLKLSTKDLKENTALVEKLFADCEMRSRSS